MFLLLGEHECMFSWADASLCELSSEYYRNPLWNAPKVLKMF